MFELNRDVRVFFYRVERGRSQGRGLASFGSESDIFLCLGMEQNSHRFCSDRAHTVASNKHRVFFCVVVTIKGFVHECILG